MFALLLHQATAAELEGETADEAADDLDTSSDDSAPVTTGQILLRSCLKLGAGVAVCAIFSDPLVDSLTNLSRYDWLNNDVLVLASGAYSRCLLVAEGNAAIPVLSP